MALYHSARGSETYTIVGSPTIVDGVVSGFSADNYLTVSNFPYTSNWEITIKAPNSTTVTYNQRCLYCSSNFQLLAGADLRWRLYVGSFYYIGDTSSDTSANFPYVKVIKKNGYISAYLSSDGISFTKKLDNVDAGNTPDGTLSFSSSVNYWQGTIDLNHTYITVNGQPWFGMCPVEVKKHQIMGPMGYTVVGSPTITDGVASGFSNSDYLRIASSITANSVEYVLDIDGIASSSSLQCIFRSSGSGGFYPIAYVQTNNQVRGYYTASDGTNVYLNNTQVFSQGFFKFYFDQNSAVMSYSADGESWTVVATGAKPPKFSSGDGTRIGLVFDSTLFGYATASIPQFNGSINLNHTYIKVNGKLWFWQPQETKKIIVNGVQVWQKPS